MISRSSFWKEEREKWESDDKQSRSRSTVQGITEIWNGGDHLGAGLALAGDLVGGGGASRGRGPEGDP